MQNVIFHLQNLSALHVGTGQGVGVVDLPIARAKATNLPIVPGSGLKGVLRDEWADKIGKENINTLFGKTDNADHASAIAFGDAQLLLLPIRSFAGTVAYATCPFILRQYKRDLRLDLKVDNLDKTAYVTNDSALLIGDKIALEDLDINAKANPMAEQWATQITEQLYPQSVADNEDWQTAVKSRFVILPDSVFSFLADTATEIRTRIRIDRATRVVKNGALWTEENLPADSVLWGVIGVSDARDNSGKKCDELLQLLPQGETSLQIGGKHTVGRGLCRLLIGEGK